MHKTLTRKSEPKRGEQAELLRRLMKATGMTEEGCRKCLVRGTEPRNPLIAMEWKKVIASQKAGRS